MAIHLVSYCGAQMKGYVVSSNFFVKQVAYSLGIGDMAGVADGESDVVGASVETGAQDDGARLVMLDGVADVCHEHLLSAARVNNALVAFW